MKDVHAGHDAPGIKLFGTTICLQERQEVKIKDEELSTKSDEPADKRPGKIIPCPRCKSMETKFCYFNNYNVNQPRHFCKGCQRYWTAGGALRNVPVGAGRRKSKPPHHGLAGFSEVGFGGGCLFDPPGGMHQLKFDGVVLEEWQMAAAAAHGSFRHVFPAKRQRTATAGQSC